MIKSWKFADWELNTKTEYKTVINISNDITCTNPLIVAIIAYLEWLSRPTTEKNILEKIININNINLSNIDIFENKDNEIRIKDENIASKWLNYHDNKAQYRMLCSSCNSHFGSYGY